MSKIIAQFGKNNFAIFLLANAELESKLVQIFDETSFSEKHSLKIPLSVFQRLILVHFYLD